jgi:hypothetical protein
MTGPRAILRGMRVEREPLIGSEALNSGALNRHQLRTRYRAIFPNVHLSKDVDPSLELRTVAAWLWSGRTATIAGAAAAALRGAKWIPDDVPVELIHSSSRSPRGVLTRRCALLDGETQTMVGSSGWGGSSCGWLRRTIPAASCAGCGGRWPRRVCVQGFRCALRVEPMRFSHPGRTLEARWRKPEATRRYSWVAPCSPCPPARNGGVAWARRGPGCAATPRRPVADRVR